MSRGRPQRGGNECRREVRRLHRPTSGCADLLVRIRSGVVGSSLLLLPAVTQAAELPAPDLTAVERRVRAAIEKELATAAREPDSPSTWGRLAMTLHAHQFDEEAAAAYAEGSRLAPGDFRWVYLRANVEEARDPAMATALYGRAVEIDPAYAPARIRLASAMEKVGLAADADEHYREAARLEPDNAVAHLGLGRLALARGDVDQATRHLERAYELSPETQAVVAMLSRARHRAGDRDGARRLAQAARELPPLLHQRDPRRAEVDLLAVDSESFLRRSKTYRETGQLQASLGELRRLIELEPGNAQAHFAAAGVHDRMNRPQEAVAAARRALELDPDLAGGRAVLAGALFKLGQFGEAAAEAERVLAEDPADIHMLLVTTMLAMRENDVERALERLDRAAGVGASEPRMRELMIQLQLELADALGGAGLYDDAARRIEQVVETLERAGAGDSELQPHRRRLSQYRERARG
ncbi:MAG: tetratricopeptide repeat protein [Acidobacteria bacterium]|nr:tetratricopeptide repeat protein [Acidobacteriota bacterium]